MCSYICGTSRRHKKPYYDLSAHGPLIGVDDCVWFKKTAPVAGGSATYLDPHLITKDSDS